MLHLIAIELKIVDGCLTAKTNTWTPFDHSNYKIPLDQLTLIRWEKSRFPAKYQKYNTYHLYFIEKPLDVCLVQVRNISPDNMMDVDRFCKEHSIKLVDIDNEPFLVPYDGHVDW